MYPQKLSGIAFKMLHLFYLWEYSKRVKSTARSKNAGKQNLGNIWDRL